jgi:hypothetical protein
VINEIQLPRRQLDEAMDWISDDLVCFCHENDSHASGFRHLSLGQAYHKHNRV